MSRGILLFFIILGFSSCIQPKNGESRTTNLYINTNPQNINREMNKHQMRYSIVYLNMDKQSKEIDKIFFEFGDELDKHGLVLKVKSQKISEKKDYFVKIQNQLGGSFEYYDSPFLIFFKKNKNGFTPYKMLSFNNIPKECLKESLSEIDKRIRNHTIEKELNNVLFTTKKPICQINTTLTQKDSYNLSTLYELLKILLDTVTS